MAAGNLVPVPRIAEIEAQRDGFANERWERFYSDLAGQWTDACTSDEARWERMVWQDSVQKVVQTEIDDYDKRLQEDLRRHKIEQEQLAWTLARFSPVSAYQLAAMTIAETGTGAKARSEAAMADYRSEFNQFVADKKEETRPGSRVMSGC